MMSGHTPRGVDRADSERGVALIASLLLMALLMSLGLGLVATTAIEPAISRNVELSVAATAAADAAIVTVAHALQSATDWSSVLRGAWSSPLLEAPSAPGPRVEGPLAPTWAGLTNLATCGRAQGCSDADTTAATLERPWGANNPRYVLLGVIRIGDSGSRRRAEAFEVAVWAGDDPEESDGDPWTDGGADPSDPLRPNPGRGMLIVRAESFGRHGARAVRQVGLVRADGGVPFRFRWP